MIDPKDPEGLASVICHAWEVSGHPKVTSRERLGVLAFLKNARCVDFEICEERSSGYDRARLYVYGLGVAACARQHPGEVIENPWPQFSPAWEAWGEGWNDQAGRQ